jgi:hypothetical protein
VLVVVLSLSTSSATITVSLYQQKCSDQLFQGDQCILPWPWLYDALLWIVLTNLVMTRDCTSNLGPLGKVVRGWWKAYKEHMKMLDTLHCV